MKNPITTTQQFVVRHKPKITFVAGSAIGVGVGMFIMKNSTVRNTLPRHFEISMNVTGDQLKQIITESKNKGFIVTDAAKGVSIRLSTLDAFK